MKVCFIYDPETNDDFLNIIRKMTPGCKGIWKNMVAVTKIEDADWCVVIDSTTKQVPEQTLYIGAHPYMEGYSGYRDLSDKKYKLDLKDTFGFGEWWLKYDYDELNSLKTPTKHQNICYVVSNSGGEYGRDKRKEFAVTLARQGVDVYGRIKGVGHGELGMNALDSYWFGKEDVLRDFKYSVEVDVGLTSNYFSERVFDSLLMWCMPLYWGGTNLEDYLPKESFKYIDIYGDGKDVINPPEPNYKAIGEARDMLLNKYQLWARTYEYLRNICV